MGSQAEAERDAWLRAGGVVVTASERTARALTLRYHRARQAEGLTAWESPAIQDWKQFVRAAWSARVQDGRLVLNPAQEQAVWAGIAAADGRQSQDGLLATALEGPLHRLAGMAMEAHALVCGHQPRLLRASARSGWQNDAGAFSRWMSSFEDICRAEGLVSPARLPVELVALLEDGADAARPALLLAGFDRLLPTQRAVFDAWGSWREAAAPQPAGAVTFYEAVDENAELAACARWCGLRLAADPEARLLVVTQDAAKRRGALERAFLGLSGPAAAPVFEFSLGVPLAQVALARTAHLVLRWLSGALAENQIDWLFSTGYLAWGDAEAGALQAHMRALRRRGLEQPEWTLAAWLESVPAAQRDDHPLAAWVERMTRAQRELDDVRRRARPPLEWAEGVPRLLETAGWAGGRTGGRALGSAEFQAVERWQQALQTAGSLGFDGRRMEWQAFVSLLGRTLEETLFTAESRNAPILIAGPAESAGLTADAVWFLGATEDAWPNRGATHPLLPPAVQREAGMPHATALLDWELAESITRRLVGTAVRVCFSFPRQAGGAEMRASRLVSPSIAATEPLPAELLEPPAPAPLTVLLEDTSRIPHPLGRVAGGAGVLTAQSQCGFKAFATARLGAQGWEAGAPALNYKQRGQLLHDVLHAVWAGPPEGIRSHGELRNIADLKVFVFRHVQTVFKVAISPELRHRLPARYLELEQERLTRLVAAWLEYEAARVPFEVVETEAEHEIALAGLALRLRLDRLDRLSDGTVLVVDYKTGVVRPNVWDPPRPDDVQLPLYARFALKDDQELGGLVFARLRAGDLCFAGSVGAPAETLFAGLTGSSSLMKNTMSYEKIAGWDATIEQLAKDFIAGRAPADPRDPPATCSRCGLHTLCRIQENQPPEEEDGAEAGEDGDDE